MNNINDNILVFDHSIINIMNNINDNILIYKQLCNHIC